MPDSNPLVDPLNNTVHLPSSIFRELMSITNDDSGMSLKVFNYLKKAIERPIAILAPEINVREYYLGFVLQEKPVLLKVVVVSELERWVVRKWEKVENLTEISSFLFSEKAIYIEQG